MKYTSALVATGSGSIGGLTASHNKGGQYVRRRAIPTNPQSSQQVAVRNALATLASRWGDVLTPAERAAWDVYAANVPKIDTLGNSINLSGMQWYVACNTPRIQEGTLSIIDAGPTVYQLASLTDPSFAFDATADEIDVTFTNTDGWAGEVGGALLVFASRPQSPSINFFKGPYRFAGVVLGAATPPTSPASISLPFVIAAGQKVFAQVRAVRADGRISSPFRGSGIGA